MKRAVVETTPEYDALMGAHGGAVRRDAADVLFLCERHFGVLTQAFGRIVHKAAPVPSPDAVNALHDLQKALNGG